MERKNGRGIFYGVIGVATLVVAIIGATFAYFTASDFNDNTITGNMATVKLALSVEKIQTKDESTGMIPMSNGMVEAALTSEKGLCVDANENAVCQVYKITITNDSAAAQYVDGYVSLRGGSGAATDVATVMVPNEGGEGSTAYTYKNTPTTMRWAQAIKDGEDYSTAGDQILGSDTEKVTFEDTLASTSVGFNTENILVNLADFTDDAFSMGNNPYQVIDKNFIRISDHSWNETGAEVYNRTEDMTSALVFNKLVAGTKEGVPGTAEFYIVVWLAETGTNQNPGVGENPETGTGFFSGNVTFISAQGSEVSATFSGYSRVEATDNTQTVTPSTPSGEGE